MKALTELEFDGGVRTRAIIVWILERTVGCMISWR